MRFENQQESSNIEDRRGGGSGGGKRGLGGLKLPKGKGGLGLIGLLVVAAVGYFSGGLGGAISAVAGGGGGGLLGVSPSVSSESETPVRSTPEEEQLKSFVGKVPATTETCWQDLFPTHYRTKYDEPNLVLFRDGVRSACGQAASSMGPFYCPGDNKVYIDLSFLDQMERSLGAGGDFAQAYVVAHEVGHHIQNLLGMSRKVQAQRTRLPEAEYNKLSVCLELQADYYAGCWAHYVQNNLRSKARIEMGDYEEAIGAAHAVGDDTLQKRATGRIVPEKFTHGTAKQRAKWFRLGYQSGDPTEHDPFRDERR
ncbi:MAG: neutral zinc metallopeptidase [Planctomycetota bacterium]